MNAQIEHGNHRYRLHLSFEQRISWNLNEFKHEKINQSTHSIPILFKHNSFLGTMLKLY